VSNAQTAASGRRVAVPSLTAILGGIGFITLVGAVVVLQPVFGGDGGGGAASSDATQVYSLAFQTAAAADDVSLTGSPDQFDAMLAQLEGEWSNLSSALAERHDVSNAELQVLDRAVVEYLRGVRLYATGDTSPTEAGQSLQVVASGLQRVIDSLAVSADAEQARESEARLLGTVLVAVTAVTFAGAVARIQRSSQRAHQAAGERERLLSMAEGMSAGLITSNRNGRVDYLNTRAAELLSTAVESTIGQPLEAAYAQLSMADDRRAALSVIPTTADLADDSRFVVEPLDERGLVLDISRFAIEVNGRRTGTGHLIRDITREYEVDRMKTEFVAVASHELRTPLTGILGYSELLQDDTDLSDVSRGWADRVVDEAGRLSEIVEDLLNVTRIESGRLQLKPVSIELPRLLEEVHGHFTGGRHSEAHEMVLDMDYRGDAFADPGKLREVLINLVDNAVKYSPNGGEVRIFVERRDDRAVISVSDEGIGIAEEDLPRLFQRFQRVGGAGTATIRGTGLGLYIVKTFIEAMDGDLTVTSTLGEGSTFSIGIPRVDLAMAA